MGPQSKAMVLERNFYAWKFAVLERKAWCTTFFILRFVGITFSYKLAKAHVSAVQFNFLEILVWDLL